MLKAASDLLKFDGARWGAAALEALRHDTDGPDSAVIARRADAALKAANRVTGLPARVPAMPADIAARFEVYPSGRTLPAGFTDGSVIPSTLPYAPACVWLMAAPKCLLRFIPLRPDAPEAILFVDQHVTSVFEQAGDGTWRKTAAIGGMPTPDALRNALRQGAFTLEPHVEPDLVIGGERAVVIPVLPPVSAKPR